MQISLFMHHQSSPKRVLLIDEQPLYRQAITSLIVEDPNWRLIGDTASIEKGIALAHNANPDLILLGLKHQDRIAALKEIRLSQKTSVILALADSYDEKTRLEALKAGANDYLCRDIEAEEFRIKLGHFHDVTYLEYIRSCYLADSSSSDEEEPLPHWASQLSKQEQKVVVLLTLGKCNKLIGRELNIAEGTVKVHLKSVYKKLNCVNRAQVVKSVLQNRALHHRLMASQLLTKQQLSSKQNSVR